MNVILLFLLRESLPVVFARRGAQKQQAKE
jgi:hypothetical protein